MSYSGFVSAIGGLCVHGVTFQPFGVTHDVGPVTNGSVTVEETNPHFYPAGDQVLSSTAAPFSTLGTSDRGLPSTDMYASHFGSIRVDRGGLAPGSTYRLQPWIKASTVATGSLAPKWQYFDSTSGSGVSTSVTLDANTSNAEGGLGQHVIGTFTASDAAASFSAHRHR